MITDDIRNIEKYREIPKEICEFIKNMPADCGRHEINSEDYVNIEIYETKSPEKGIFESHKKYIDIQIILSGTERIDFTDMAGLTVDIPYNDEKDIIFYRRENVNAGRVILKQGQFAVFYPHEAHMPQLTAEGQSVTVKKALVKIKV